MKTVLFLSIAWTFLSVAACTGQEEPEMMQPESTTDRMRFDVRYPEVGTVPSRVTDNHFDSGDSIGLYVAVSGQPLEPAGNEVNNAPLTWKDTSGWQAPQPVYWNGGTYDVFAYYPYTSSVTSVDDYPFEVELDQNRPATDVRPGGYEASDFLFASARGQEAGTEAVTLQFHHILSKLQVRLIKGEDFEGELPDDAEVYIHHTVPSATIDLSVGIATKYAYGSEQTIRARSLGGHKYAAIIVPQRLPGRRPLLEVVMKGVSYLVESSFVFKPGIEHVLSVVIDKNPEQVKIEIGGEIEAWEPV